MQRNITRSLGSAALTLILSMAISGPLIAKAEIQSESVTRIWGKDRYETSIEVAKKGWPGGSDIAILATGEKFPDAISAAPLAMKFDAPILLTPSTYLRDDIKSELNRLDAGQIYIVGGNASVSAAVQKALEENFYVKRVAGKDRYETSVNIAKMLGKCDEAFVVTGQDFPDALSVSPMAAMKGIPILLTEKNSLPPSVKDYLAEQGIRKTYTVNISDDVVKQLPDPEGLTADWQNIYERNISIIDAFSLELDFSNIFYATGNKFADALTGSVLAAKTSSPIVLIDPSSSITSFNGGAKELIDMNQPSIKANTVLGGEGVISSETLKSLNIIEGYEDESPILEDGSYYAVLYNVATDSGGTFVELITETRYYLVADYLKKSGAWSEPWETLEPVYDEKFGLIYASDIDLDKLIYYSKLYYENNYPIEVHEDGGTKLIPIQDLDDRTSLSGDDFYLDLFEILRNTDTTEILGVYDNMESETKKIYISPDCEFRFTAYISDFGEKQLDTFDDNIQALMEEIQYKRSFGSGLEYIIIQVKDNEIVKFIEEYRP